MREALSSAYQRIINLDLDIRSTRSTLSGVIKEGDDVFRHLEQAKQGVDQARELLANTLADANNNIGADQWNEVAGGQQGQQQNQGQQEHTVGSLSRPGEPTQDQNRGGGNASDNRGRMNFGGNRGGQTGARPGAGNFGNSAQHANAGSQSHKND